MLPYLKGKYSRFWSILALFIALNCCAVLASDPLPNDPESILWHISASKITYDDKNNVYIAEGSVLITGGKTRLEADFVEFRNKTKEAFAKGAVLLVSGEDTVTCNAVFINLETQEGTIYDGTIFIQKNHFYITGNKIVKEGEKSYRADKASVTSCSGENPDWKISANNVRVTIEGYGMADNATFWVKAIPAMYTPYIIFPVKTERQTGFLAPRMSISDRKGFQFEQPFFIAISENQDATLTMDHMAYRGTKFGLEYRYAADSMSKGAFFFDYLHDRKTDDGTAATSDFSFDATPQRTNRDRYWFRAKIDQALPFGLSAKMDIDVASDADYLHEFKEGFTGFNATNEYFEETFARTLDDYDDTTRRNILHLNRTWYNYSLNIDFEWFDEIEEKENSNLQQIPSVSFSASKQRIGTTPFFYTMNSDMTYFYREETSDTLMEGKRADFHPAVFLPLRVDNYLYIEPSAGVRQTVWWTDDYQDISGEDEQFFHRELYDLNLTVASRLVQVFNSALGSAEKIKHEIIPELSYTYIPDVDQTDLPLFECDSADEACLDDASVDRIEKENTITWSFTNRFTSRKTVQSNGKKQPLYREFAWIKLHQSYDINKERKDNEDPFSDIYLESELNPCEFFSFNSDISWSPYENHLTSHESGITVKDTRGDFFYTQYRWEEETSDIEESESLYSQITITFTDQLSAYVSHEEDLIADEKVESAAGMTVTRQCWSISASYSETPDEREIAFLVKLRGLGEIGIE